MPYKSLDKLRTQYAQFDLDHKRPLSIVKVGMRIGDSTDFEGTQLHVRARIQIFLAGVLQQSDCPWRNTTYLNFGLLQDKLRTLQHRIDQLESET